MKNLLDYDDDDSIPLYEMDFPAFSQWINVYPFVRTQIRESMMPKIWTLKLDFAVK